MSAPFVTQLRARPGVLTLGAEGGPRLMLRVEIPEVWDTVRVDVAADATVAALKAEALAAMMPPDELPAAFVMKLNGYEVLDENASIANVGAKNGSTFLLTHRRRRPVR